MNILWVNHSPFTKPIVPHNLNHAQTHCDHHLKGASRSFKSAMVTSASPSKSSCPTSSRSTLTLRIEVGRYKRFWFESRFEFRFLFKAKRNRQKNWKRIKFRFTIPHLGEYQNEPGFTIPYFEESTQHYFEFGNVPTLESEEVSAEEEMRNDEKMALESIYADAFRDG